MYLLKYDNQINIAIILSIIKTTKNYKILK